MPLDVEKVGRKKSCDETQCLFHISTHSPYNTYTLTHISITDSPVELIKEKKLKWNHSYIMNVTKNQISYCQIPERGDLINALQFCQDILYFLRTSPMQKLKYQRTHNTVLQWWDKRCWRVLEWLLYSFCLSFSKLSNQQAWEHYFYINVGVSIAKSRY